MVEELAPRGPGMGSIRVSGYRSVPVTKRVQSMIDHPCFQRLRKVRQLGPIHWVYPGATHTRFEHSIGVYGTTREFLIHLLQFPEFASRFSEAQLLGVLAAGLLHDLGHYPFAHSLEAVHHAGGDTPRHETLGADILMGRFPQLHPGAPPLCDLLRWEWQTSPELVARLITESPEALPSDDERLLKSIISGTIDADKMDYMERDGTHLGLPYGSHYDRDRLLSSLRVSTEGDSIAISAKGKLSAESFIFCRFTLFSEVYWHHAVRSASAMVQSALQDIMPHWKPDNLSLALLQTSDDALLKILQEHAPRGSRGARLLAGLTGDTRELHKRVLTLSPAYHEEAKKSAYERLLHASECELDSVRHQLERRLESFLGHELGPATLLIDVPPRDKDTLDPFPIQFDAPMGQTQYKLGEFSSIVRGIGADMTRVVKKIRIYCAPATVAELRGREAELETVLLEQVLLQ